MKLTQLEDLFVVSRGESAYLFASLEKALTFVDTQLEARLASFVVRALAL